MNCFAFDFPDLVDKLYDFRGIGQLGSFFLEPDWTIEITWAV